MPLVGTICCQTGEPRDFEYCLACARGDGPANCAHPLPLIKYMAGKEKSREGVGLSATGIISCPRQNILLGEEDYYEDPRQIMPLFRGDAWHAAFEMWVKDEPHIISERRLEKEVPGTGIVLSGKPDQVTPHRELIIDIKSTSRPVDCTHLEEWPGLHTMCEKGRIKEPYEEHEQQVNIYAWLYRGGKFVDTGEVVNITITRGGINYVDGRSSVKFPVRIWEPDEQDSFVAERILPRLRYEREGLLPPVLAPEKIIKSKKTGKRVVKRHWKCKGCPVRFACDARAVEETGLIPDEPEYWDLIEEGFREI